MLTVEIKGTVPGAGKTTLLVEYFVTSTLSNKVLLCPSNKDRQVCIEKAIDFGMTPKEAEKSIKTLRKFKGNYFKQVDIKEVYDPKTGKYIKEKSKPYYRTKHSKPHYGKIWNIFIDEAAMISKEEMDDLVKNWRINLLMLAGDSLQFCPVGNENVLCDGNIVLDEWVDIGTPYDLHIDYQLLLTKSLRSVDPKLTKAINLIKEGKVVEAIVLICQGRNPERCQYENTDWHIAYTNNACDRINKKYENGNRYIITLPDNRYKFWKSEILDINDKRFVQLNDMLIMANAKNPKVPLFADWLKIHASPAYAVTCHKLQGTTISKDKIYIHLGDILFGIRGIIDDEKRAEILQRFLYVAVSRATSLDQIELCGFGENPLIEDITSRRHPLKKNDKGEYVPDLDSNDIVGELAYTQSKINPMAGESILEDAFKAAGNDDSARGYLKDIPIGENTHVDDIPQEYKDMISRAHSGSRKWTDEKLKSYGDDAIGLRNDLIACHCDKRRREEILTRYTKLTGIVVPKETKEERKERLSKAHSKPRKNGWTDKKLLSYESVASLMNALSTCGCDRSRREKLLTRYAELRGVIVPKETEEERKERISKAHSGSRKSSKWTDEKLMSYTDREALKKKVKNYKKPIRERILNEWDELHNVNTEETKTIVEEPKSNENVEKVQASPLITNTKEVEGVRRIEGKALQKKEDKVKDELTHKHQSSKNYVDTDEEALEQSLDILIQDSHSRVE